MLDDTPQKQGCSMRIVYYLSLNLYLCLSPKIRIFTLEPRFLVSKYEGIKKPERLLTVGSGEPTLENKKSAHRISVIQRLIKNCFF